MLELQGVQGSSEVKAPPLLTCGALCFRNEKTESYHKQHKVQPLPSYPWLRMGPKHSPSKGIEGSGVTHKPTVYREEHRYPIGGVGREKSPVPPTPASSQRAGESLLDVSKRYQCHCVAGMVRRGTAGLEVCCKLLSPQSPPPPVQAARVLSTLRCSQSKGK